MAAPFEDRLNAFGASVADADAEAAVISPGPNLYYLAGWYGEPEDRHTPLVVVPGREPRFVAPEAYVGQVRNGSWVENVRPAGANDPEVVADAVIDELPAGVRTVLVDDHARFSFVRRLYERLPAGAVGSVGEIVRGMRRRKGDREVAALERAARVADEVSEAIRALGEDVLGRTEADLATEIRSRLHAEGGERVSFDVVVGSGPNGARPELRSGDREIRGGEPVVLDFGAFVDRYASDQTRVVVFGGDPPDGFEAVHRTVKDALEAGIDAVEPGVTAADVHRATTRVVEDRGYADGLKHATGHGVGLEAHEPPAIDEGSDLRLEPGMVFSVEPGVYLDEWGVRLEDLVVVTDDGRERLNDSAYTWKPL
jgi:Xaa-Pro aminopeptidase